MDAAPVMVGDSTLILRSRSIVVDTVASRWVWNRPIAVLVQGRSGSNQYPIIDITALIQAVAFGFTALWAMKMYGKHVYSLVRKVR